MFGTACIGRNAPLPRGAIVLSAMLVAFVIPGCSGGPSLSGFGFAGTRIVSAGDELVLRSPAGADGTRRWRVASFDSLYLQIVQPPRLQRDGDGGFEIVTRARARTAGRTELVLVESGGRAGQNARKVSYIIRILE